MQLQTTWEKDRAIYTFKNGSGMKVIGAAESVNKCKGKIKKLWRYLESRESDATMFC